jgi:hypothetical protein
MRIDDIIIENLEEGPVWDKTRKVGATIGKGIGGVSQAVGAVAGVPAGIARGIAKGYNRAADTIAGGPDENPQSGSAQAPQQSQGQRAGSSFAQGLQGGAGSGSSGNGAGAAVAGKMRQQAKQLMTMADELEKGGDSGGGGAQKAEPQAQQSAPPTQTNQEPQAQQTAQEPNQVQEPTQTTQEPPAPETPADNVSTPSSTSGSYNNQIGNGKANYGVTTNFDPKTMKNVSTPLDSKAVGVVPNTTNPTTNNKDQQANLKARLQSKQGIGNKTNSGFKDSGVGKPVQKIVGADKQGNPVVSTVREDIQYYSKFFKKMI